MKHTKRRLLAVLLVLAMTLGMVPMLVLTAGAEIPVLDDAVIGEDGAIADLNWANGYIGSPAHDNGNHWKTVATGANASYRYSDVVKIPKAGTTLVWSESTVKGSMSQNAMLLTSWKATEDGWVIDTAGANVVAQPRTSNQNQHYDATNEVITYFYTTTRDNEYLRFSCYGGLADNTYATTAEACPKVYAYTPAFMEGETAGEGTVDVEWIKGFVGSYTNDYGYINSVKIEGFVPANDYNLSMPIIVPKAGTTLYITEAADSPAFSTDQAYAFSTWTVGADGRLDLFYGLSAGATDSVCLTVDGEGNRHYAYTTSYDNEIVRVTTRGTATPALTYKENNAEAWAPALIAAGFDATQAGKPYMLGWYSGLIGVGSGSLVSGSPVYSFSDVIPVYGKGTTITFTDLVHDAEAGASNFASDTVYTVARFDGSDYTGVSGAAVAMEMIGGGCVGDGATARDEAFYAGKRVYTYTTTEDIEYIRLCYSNVGNEVNGATLAPMVYITAPGEGTCYNELEGLKMVAIGDSYLYGGGAHVDATWLAKLGGLYNMDYYNYGKDGSTVSNYVTTNNPMVDRYTSMVDGADLVIFEGGRNDYNQNVPLGEIGELNSATFLGAVQIVLNGLIEKNPDALIVCVTPWNLVDLDATGLTSNKVNEAGLRTEDYANAFASYVESLNSDRVIALRACDNDVMPVFMTNATFRKLYCVGANDISHLNDAGHDMVLSWFEQIIGKAFQNFGGISAEGGAGVRFVNDSNEVAVFGTVSGARNVTVPAAPAGIAAENVFGWAGVLTNGNTSQFKIFRAGEKVTFQQGDAGVFEPLILEMEQIAEPEFRLNGTVGLRFLAAVSDAQYKALLGQIGAGEMGTASITVGMLIVPAQYVADMDGELTHASLDAAEKKRVDVVSDIEWNDDDTLNWYKYEDGYGYVAGTVNDILQQNHARKYTARGYVKLTVNGEEFYVYAENGGLGGGTIYDAAIAALNDCRPGPNETYCYTVQGESGTVYSRYTAEQRETFAEYVDDVIALETVTNQQLGCTSADLVHYDHYDPNKNRYHVATVVSGGTDGLSDIFYPYAGAPVDTLAVKDEAWDELIATLGNDVEITSICAIVVEEGHEITIDGGVMLDGFICDLNDANSSVKCAEFMYDGYVYYLLGFSDYGVFY